MVKGKRLRTTVKKMLSVFIVIVMVVISIGSYELVTYSVSRKEEAEKNANEVVTVLSGNDRNEIFKGTRTDFRDESIYFTMVTRYYDGDEENNVQCFDGTQYNLNDPAWRGDFKGLIEKLDYIKALGFTAIWITPVVENCSGYDYHGYHAINFSKVDERYESEDCTYQDLIDACHEKDMKIIQDVVLNHTGNFGEENLLPMFTKEGDLSSSDCLKPVKNSSLPENYNTMTPGQQYQARLALMKNTDGINHDTKNIYHHYGNFNWDDYTCQLAQIAGDCVDLNTENPLVYNYLVDTYSKYIDMGVDAFRIDTVRHISRLTFNKAFNNAFKEAGKRNNKDFFMFGEVCTRDNGNYWYRQSPSMSTPYYTWKESKSYPWSDTDWKVNYDSAIQSTKDNANNINEQPTSKNALLSGNDYHKPDYSQFSGLNVIDFPMHWSFKSASNAFQVAKNGDQYYNDATWNVTYVDSHDYAPDGAPEGQRFNQDQSTWAENLSLMFTFRGIPCIYYGTETEFQKGCEIDKGPNMALADSGRAYYGDQIEGTITAMDFGEYGNVSGPIAETLKHPLSQHIQRLNRLRQAIPALRKGQYSTEGVTGNLAFKRRYTDTNTDSFVCVAISNDATFNGIPNGRYVDAVTGDVKQVSNGVLQCSVSGKGNIKAYVLDTKKTKAPGRVLTNGVYLTDGGEKEDILPGSTTVVDVSSISFKQQELSLTEGDLVKVSATVLPENASNKSISWSTNNPDVATVNNGTVTGIKPGEAVITAKTNNGLTAKLEVTVKERQMEDNKNGVYFEKPESWGDHIYVYFFSNHQTVGKEWPGTLMKKVSTNLYQFDYETEDEQMMVIFNDTKHQTADLEYINQGYYDANGFVKTIKPVEKGTVNIRYINTEGKQLECVSMSGELGSTYQTEKKTFEGYELKEEPKNAAGIYTKDDITVTYIYQKVEEKALSITIKSTAFSVFKGAIVTLTGIASGGDGNYTYRFLVYHEEKKSWYRFSDFQAENVMKWDAKTIGNRKFYVEVKDGTGKVVRSESTPVLTKE